MNCVSPVLGEVITKLKHPNSDVIPVKSFVPHACTVTLKWNPSIAATLGEQKLMLAVIIIGEAFIEGLFCTQIVHLGPGFLAVIHVQRWPEG